MAAERGTDIQLLLYINLTSHRGRTNKRGGHFFVTDIQLLLYINLTSHCGRTNKRGGHFFVTEIQTAPIIYKSSQSLSLQLLSATEVNS